MQTLAIENTGIQFFDLSNDLSKFFVQERLFLDSTLNGFEVITENNTYTFIKVGKTVDGCPKWYVLDGQEYLVGKEVEILGLSKNGLNNEISRGGSLAIYLEQDGFLSAKIWYTSKILNFSILK